MTKLTRNLIEWTRNYLNSFGGNTKAIIGISGGKDSSIAAAICVEAVGKDRVIGVRMPNGVQHDLDVAEELCEYLGITSYEFNIAEASLAYDVMLSTAFGLNVRTNSVYYSNTPARLRMTTLYGVAALIGDARVVNTCNYSEDYVGYATKFGDGAGDFSLFSNLTVREVKEIGHDLGLPDKFVEKKPEDGLSGKTDEDNLGFTYNELDSYLLDNEATGELKNKVEALHRKNLHKLEPMPSFKKEN